MSNNQILCGICCVEINDGESRGRCMCGEQTDICDDCAVLNQYDELLCGSGDCREEEDEIDSGSCYIEK